jgi:hypothetical protein
MTLPNSGPKEASFLIFGGKNFAYKHKAISDVGVFKHHGQDVDSSRIGALK